MPLTWSAEELALVARTFIEGVERPRVEIPSRGDTGPDATA